MLLLQSIKLLFRDVIMALGLITRIPVKVDGTAALQRGAAIAWAFPFVGVLIGGILYIFAALMGMSALPAPVIAILCAALASALTGALHDDALADTFDGLWGGWTTQRRLEIMKDSGIGAYGMIALIYVTALRISLYSFIIMLEEYAAFVALAANSRAMMAAVMAFLPNTRKEGLSAQVGRPSTIVALVALALALIVGLATANIGVVIGAVVGASVMAWIAWRKIGGQTGDILGAVQQIAEICAAIGFITLL